MNNVSSVDVSIEVKCSRNDRFFISKRDLEGLNSPSARGFLAALVANDAFAGPHWIFIPANKIHPRSYRARMLQPFRSSYNCFEHINYLWGEVLLNEQLIDVLLSMQINFKAREWWQTLPFTWGDGKHDAVRKLRISEALQSMRARLNEKYKRGASRREGFLHQCILCFCLNKAGYTTVSNNSGVPDLRTHIHDFQPLETTVTVL